MGRVNFLSASFDGCQAGLERGQLLAKLLDLVRGRCLASTMDFGRVVIPIGLTVGGRAIAGQLDSRRLANGP
jgi:hypothetical protein